MLAVLAERLSAGLLQRVIRHCQTARIPAPFEPRAAQLNGAELPGKADRGDVVALDTNVADMMVGGVATATFTRLDRLAGCRKIQHIHSILPDFTL
jgi:hypothetical protein